MKSKILVAGATGRTGRLIVHKLVEGGYIPHVLVRDLPAAQKLFEETVIYHHGDVREIESILPAMAGIDAVISAVGSRTPVGKNCPKHVDYEGVAHLVEAATIHRVARFILISSIAVTRPTHPMNCFGKILDWKLKGEDSLRHSGLDYTIIRPGGLKDTPGGQRALILDQGDRISGSISREDVAETCLYALNYPQPLCATFEVIEAEGKGIPNLPHLFSALVPAC